KRRSTLDCAGGAMRGRGIRARLAAPLRNLSRWHERLTVRGRDQGPKSEESTCLGCLESFQIAGEILVLAYAPVDDRPVSSHLNTHVRTKSFIFFRRSS